MLRTLDPKTRDDLRRVLMRDDADRDAIASQLMRYRDENGQRWADVFDLPGRSATGRADARRDVSEGIGIGSSTVVLGGLSLQVHSRILGHPRVPTPGAPSSRPLLP